MSINLISPMLYKIAAAGLNRVVQHMLDHPFAILSAYYDPFKTMPGGQQANEERDAQLRDLLRHFNIGFIRTEGAWFSGEIKQFLGEKSLFIPDCRLEDAHAIAQLYDQESFIFGKDGFYTFVDTASGRTSPVRKVSDDFKLVSPSQEPSPGWTNIMKEKQKGKDRGFQFNTDVQFDYDAKQSERMGLLNRNIEEQLANGTKKSEVADVIMKKYTLDGTRFKMATANLRVNLGRGYFISSFSKDIKYLWKDNVYRDEGQPKPDGGLLDVFIPIKFLDD